MYIQVDWEDARPVYQQLRDQIVEKIATGDLSPGAVLPSVRRLASELGINLHTVHKAFEALRQGGFVRLQPRFGAVVRPHPIREHDGGAALRHDLTPLLASAWLYGLGRDDIIREVDAILGRFKTAPSSTTAQLPEEGA